MVEDNTTNPVDEVTQANNQRVVDAQAAAATFVEANNEGSTSVDAPAEVVARPAVEGEIADTTTEDTGTATDEPKEDDSDAGTDAK